LNPAPCRRLCFVIAPSLFDPPFSILTGGPKNGVHYTGNGAVIQFRSANPSIGSLEGYGEVMLGMGDSGSYQIANTILTVGGNDADTEFYGRIRDLSSTMLSMDKANNQLVKVGTGTLTLWGENTYGGGTTVEEGTLLVNNWLNTAGMVMVVGEDARLGGIGTVGSVAVDGSGTLAPGMSAGTFTVYGLEMEKSTLEIEIEGDVASGLYDKLVVYGGVKLNKTSEEEGTRLLLKLGGYEPVLDGQWYTIIENDQMDAVAGGFWNAPNELDTFLDESGQYLFEITYLGGDGNDVAVRLIPEPGTLWLLMVSMLGGLLLRRARRG